VFLLPDVDGLGALELELNDSLVGQPSTLNVRIIATRGQTKTTDLSVGAADLCKKRENNKTLHKNVLIRNVHLL